VDARLPRSSKRYEAVLFHFGNGSVVIPGKFCFDRKTFDISSNQCPPRFTKLELVFGSSSGKKTSACFIGKICLRDDVLRTPPVSKLGLDFTITKDYDIDAIMKAINSSSKPIKVILLDQEKVFCGSGSWIGIYDFLHQLPIIAEILFVFSKLTKFFIKPAFIQKSWGKALTRDKIHLLVDKLKYILNLSIHCTCTNQPYPSI
jgi:hypothetical protein